MSLNTIRVFRDTESNRRFEFHPTPQSIIKRTSEIIMNAKADKSAVVFDIDDTILKNDEFTKSCDGAKPQRGMMQLYQMCLRKGIAIWFITARPDTPKNRDWTRRQLDCIGARWYNDLRMCPSNIGSISTVSRYKSQARQELIRIHRRKVIVNYGDQWSDHSSVSRVTSLNKLYTVADKGYFLFETEEPNVEWCVKLPSQNSM